MGAERPVRLEAELLGQVRLRMAGHDISREKWTVRSGRSLLLLLVVTPGHELARERVMEVLWPQLSREAARNACSKALHAVRRVLAVGSEAGGLLVADRSRIGLRPGVEIFVDAEQFELGVTHAPRDEAGRRVALRQALALYRGDLLATEIDAEWAEARRETLRRLRRTAALELAALDLQAAAPLASVGELEALPRSDETDEAVHRALIQAYLAGGQRDRASRQYERCLEVLRRELGVGPEAETAALHRVVMRGAAPAGSPAPPLLRYAPPVPPTPMVGRVRDLETIEELVSQRAIRLVTLTGPGGVGKTRLALEVARRLSGEFAHGACQVELAAVSEAGLVPAVIARALGVQEQGRTPLTETLRRALADR